MAKRTNSLRDGFRHGSSYRHFAGVVEGNRHYGWVSGNQLKRDIDEGFKHFMAKRPELDVPVHDKRWQTKRQTTPSELAAAYLALPNPPPGVLTRMCKDNGCTYGSVAVLLYRMRKPAKQKKVA